MNPAELFTRRLVAELGDLNFQLLRTQTELEVANMKIAQLENELDGHRSAAQSASEVQQ